MADLTPDRGLLFHFTAVENLSEIVARQALLSDTRTLAEGCLQVEAGDPSIKSRRRSLQVPVGPGGHPSDYVPFYYAPRSPMLYKISCGGVPTYSGGQAPLVYLVCRTTEIVASGRPYVFSDGNCASSITEYYEDLADLDKLDWDVFNATMWSNTADDPDRMRRRMAEFLVHDHVPLAAVIGVATLDAATRDLVTDILGPSFSAPITVRRGWYY
jgi:hypothetical protein